MNRRGFLLSSCSATAALVIPGARGGDSADEWSKGELIEPSELVKKLKSPGTKPHIFCVTFPVLYRQKHILGSTFAGPAGKPEGIAALHAAAAALSKETAIVIYCGCCPMKTCPNVHPAYRALRELEYNNLRVLNLFTNFHTDWVAKGYPVEP